MNTMSGWDAGSDAVPMAHGQLRTTYGAVEVAATTAGVREVALPRWDGTIADRESAVPPTELAPGAPAECRVHLEHALAELGAYFGGARRTFTVPLDPVGTPFVRRVWAAVAAVPYGQTRSYGEIAAEIGAAGAARAVGRANAINAVAPFIPCHRIVGSDGRLTGYGPGLPMKLRLLRMEDALPAGASDYDAWVDRVAARCPGQQVYLGLRRTRTYCRPGCDRSRAEAELPARLFSSPDEARAAGFAPCPSCAW
jgi:methylated-DNA-[protein]-cysteine S-methyltransferase